MIRVNVTRLRVAHAFGDLSGAACLILVLLAVRVGGHHGGGGDILVEVVDVAHLARRDGGERGERDRGAKGHSEHLQEWE